MAKYKQILQIIKSKDVLFRALKIALVVGVILNIINQGDYFFNMQLEKINILKVILTFMVPFFVSVYTAVLMKLNAK